ncbi:DUF4249 domain-containing protein [Flavihumibacter petaseus]|uniref:DUF4249 domain-containing protein n=1 Tax=Flavihumibacter petaseus NBRC 106054 TaxID=1220578 RepID=A0A0E9MW76_9BACT|nr:DUF4249 domain-containing protein [Flavihumibacter petaseus]GAO41982.1 hypothetical protein FPE01S_01_09950 [Flavihumibacter petaseus NBRC 106054]
MKPSFIFYLSLLAFATSCEKVIHVDTDTAATKLVIEGTISNQADREPEVRISTTKAIDDNNNFIGVSGAAVTISDDNGNTWPLAEGDQGIYQTAAFTGAPGKTYHLSVTVNGQQFTASSTMPATLVPLDSLDVTEMNYGDGMQKTVRPYFNDPAGQANYYRLVQYANQEQVKKIFIQNDELSDGKTISWEMMNPDGDLRQGDDVQVDLLCIDEPAYKYWYTLLMGATGENQGPTPSNPVTNIQGGALGYFSAYSVSTKSIIIP